MAVFFDLQKAYDTVWRSEILISLHKMGLRGNLPCFIEKFLSNRRTSVRIASQHSDYVTQEEGVPQGSVLSVTCFAIAINDITKQMNKNVYCTLYVDDFAIYAASKKERHTERLLQTTINRLEQWTKERGMKFSQEKTVAIKFSKRRRGPIPRINLYRTPINIVESTRYLGLVIDSRLSWKQHVEYLRTNCIPAMNLLKHLSHLSWGADRKTLLKLYTSLVKSKLDYGCQIYSRVKTKILNRLDPIQNECLRACLGAFKSSPAISLCAESGVMPLDYARDITSLKFLYKIRAQPESLTYKALLDDTQENVSPTKEWYNDLQNKYSLPNPILWDVTIPEKPPWKLLKIQICTFLEVSKQSTPEYEARQYFLEHKKEHSGLHVFTDGSKSSGGVGYAAVFPNNMLYGKLVTTASIYTAELYAIKTAVEYIAEENIPSRKYTIFSDSQSALQALAPKMHNSPLVQKIKQKLSLANSKNIEICFCWVPAHCDIPGNEKADKLAKEAALTAADDRAVSNPIPHTDIATVIQGAVKKRWQLYWLGGDHRGQKLLEIKEEISTWSSANQKNRKIECVLARLRIGHTNVTHAYLMEGLTNPPQCETCHTVISVKHILMECTKYSPIRRKYFRNASLSSMIGDNKEFSVEKLTLFLQETGLLNQI